MAERITMGGMSPAMQYGLATEVDAKTKSRIASIDIMRGPFLIFIEVTVIYFVFGKIRRRRK